MLPHESGIWYLKKTSAIYEAREVHYTLQKNVDNLTNYSGNNNVVFYNELAAIDNQVIIVAKALL
eukprot:snap_masked-scaffold_4-processed-gene-4.28-mRNA-1 protein AED:1.00 eAED:1.00 QI:0/-1/0/0/-1/1/1/0/64